MPKDLFDLSAGDMPVIDAFSPLGLDLHHGLIGAHPYASDLADHGIYSPSFQFLLNGIGGLSGASGETTSPHTHSNVHIRMLLGAPGGPGLNSFRLQ